MSRTPKRFNAGRGTSETGNGIKPVLTYLKAARIRERAAAGEKQSALAKEFGVLPSEICQIVARKRFREDVEAYREQSRIDKAYENYQAALDRYNEWRAQRNRERSEIDRLHCFTVKQ